MVALAFQSGGKENGIVNSVTFLPTYFVGIVAWVLHGIQIGSFAVVIPCAIQLAILPFLISKSIAQQKRKEQHEL